MPVVAPELADALVQAGELQILRLNQSFVIEGSENVWFVKTGRIDIFAVQLEGDEATGPRSHFLLLEAGSLVLGMNFASRNKVIVFCLPARKELSSFSFVLINCGRWRKSANMLRQSDN
jgi:hypothetical protein